MNQERDESTTVNFAETMCITERVQRRSVCERAGKYEREGPEGYSSDRPVISPRRPQKRPVAGSEPQS